MTTDNKPPMFGPSAVIDPATYEPRSGKSPEVASPDCAPLASMTEAQKADPAFQAELLKKCPRAGTAFKPSPKKEY